MNLRNYIQFTYMIFSSAVFFLRDCSVLGHFETAPPGLRALYSPSGVRAGAGTVNVLLLG